MGGNLAQRESGRAGAARKRARALVANQGRSALDYHKLHPGNRLFFAADQGAFMAFREEAGAAVDLGDPVGPRASAAALIGAFAGACRRAGRAPVFLQIDDAFLEDYRCAGLSPVRIGVAALIELASFDTRAPAAKPLRHALRRTAAEGLCLRRLEPPIAPEELARIREANESWLTLPGSLERGFTSGRFDEAQITQGAVTLLEERDGRVAAFTTWIPSPTPGEATVDLIRRRACAPPGTLDALITGVLHDARDRGFDRFDLGLAPLARIEAPFAHPAERVLALLFRHGPAGWGQRGLYRWKAKFGPRWVPRWLAYRGGPLAFARAALAVRRVARAHVIASSEATKQSPSDGRSFANSPENVENDVPRLPMEVS